MSEPLATRLARLGMSLYDNENKELVAEGVEAVHERDAALAAVDQVLSLTGDIGPEARRILSRLDLTDLARAKADAWDEGCQAGNTNWPASVVKILNPYRTATS